MSAEASPQDDDLVELFTFRVGGEDYALDIKRVREIIHPLPVTPVPRAPAFVEGVIQLRNEVLPVVDVRKRFGLPVQEGRRAKFLIVQVARCRVALVVDEVAEVVRVRRSDLRASPPMAGQGPRFFLGVSGGEGSQAVGSRRPAAPSRIRLLLNVKALLEPEASGERDSARAQVEATKRV